MKKHTQHVLTTSIVLGVLAIGGIAFAYSGLYNIGADDQHTAPVYNMLTTLREHSIASRVKELQPPDLADPARIRQGAGNYNAMCTGCHLAPGMAETELSKGLYPAPPNLTQHEVKAPVAFWVIKHGIKASGMPAWGKSMGDEYIWNMAAFLQKLPTLSEADYKALVASSGGHSHGGGETGGHHHEEGAADHHHDDSAEDPPHEEGAADHHHGDSEHEHSPAEAGSGAPADGHSHSHAEGAEHEHGGGEGKVAKASAPSMEGLVAKAVPAAEAVADTFHTALQKGDRAAVLALLAPEVSVREGGETQTREEYAAGHLGADIAFLKEATIKPVSMGSMPMGDTAMVGSRSEIRTKHDGKPVALASTEMLTLKKTPGGWLITEIEWASDKLPQ